MSEVVLCCEDLCRTYQDGERSVSVLQAVDLALRAGEKIAVVGAGPAGLIRRMEKPLRKAQELGLPLYCGEFGVYEAAPEADRIRWYRDMLQIFEKHGVSWANWNYKSDQFGFVGLDGKPIEAVQKAMNLD